MMFKKLIPFVTLALFFSCSSEIEDELDAEGSNTGGNTPPIVNASNYQIAEHTTAGMSIGTVSAQDQNNDVLSFFMDSDFDVVINENTGELTVGESLILDFEANDAIPFTVTVFDGSDATDFSSTIAVTDVNEYEILNMDQRALVDYFSFLNLHKESSSPNTNIRKWENNLIIYLDGNVDTGIRQMVEDALNEINAIITNSDFTISITENRSAANAVVFFGSAAQLQGVWPDIFNLVNGSSAAGFTSISFSNNVIGNSRIWVSSTSEVLFKHELGHGLGLGHSTICASSAPGSFMCPTVFPDFSILPAEREVLRLLYHEDVEAGLTEQEIRMQVSNIILLEQ